jgi:hypothetical protein
LGQAINLAALTYRLQAVLFERALAANDATRTRVIDFADIERDPARAAMLACAVFDLPVDMKRLDRAIDISHRVDAKSPGRTYSARDHERQDSEIEHHHGTAIDQALAWVGTLSEDLLALA